MGTKWFAISFSKAGTARITAWLDTLFGGGPGRSGVEVGPDEIQVRMADFKFTVPRSSVRSVRRSQARLGGAAGVHASRGRLLVNGSDDGLVELAIDPPCYTGRTLNTMFVKEKVTALTPEPGRPRRIYRCPPAGRSALTGFRRRPPRHQGAPGCHRGSGACPRYCAMMGALTNAEGAR